MGKLNEFKGFAVRYMAKSNDNKRRMIMYGCDGTNHAIWTATEHLNSKGITIFAEDHGMKVICKCTGRCKNKLMKRGGFLGDNHPSVFAIPVTTCNKDPETCSSIPPGTCGVNCHGFQHKIFNKEA